MAATAERTPIGGQAVINGVMMRSDDGWAVAVRAPDGSIAVHAEPRPAPSTSWARVPVVRGVVALASSLVVGIRAMRFSITVTEGRPVNLGPSVALGFAIAVPLFFVLPALAATFGGGDGLGFGAVEAAVRIVLLVGYIAGVGLLAEVRAVFQYHGAEHKVVNADEAGIDLTPAGAMAQSTRHPRCGTTFLLLVTVVAAGLHVPLGRLPVPELVASRLVLVPIVIGLSYEVLRLGAANLHRRWVRAVLAPAFALQALTTREPTVDQVEVALAAFVAVPAPAEVPASVEGRVGRVAGEQPQPAGLPA